MPREAQAARGIGVDQFNIYLMTHGQEETLQAYGDEIIPAVRRRNRVSDCSLGSNAMNANGAVVSASDVTRRYGDGRSRRGCVARRLARRFSTGELVAVMGPSGSGKSTLMHILAGLDKPTIGRRRVDGELITSMGDTELTKLRRRSIGFIFQFFNLLPMLKAEENVVLPLSIAGEKPDKEWLETVAEEHRASATVASTARPSSRGASSSASRSHARSSRGRRSSSPTSRPGTSTRRRAVRSSS